MSMGPTRRGRAASHEPPAPARWAARRPRPQRKTHHLLLAPLALLVTAALLVLVGCGGTTTGASGSGDGTAQINVFAAASLTDAFTKLGEQFTAAHPGVKVAFNFAGSPDLAMQIQQGAPADVVATADDTTMSSIASLAGQPTTFARNRLAIAVEPGNPKGIKSLSDLAAAGLKVVLAAPQVPAGKYALQAFAKQGVTVKPVSLEDSVKGVVTKVALGEADAGIVYVTDIAAAKGTVQGVTIPAGQNVIATYPIAVVKASTQAQDAQAFVSLVLSSAGQQTLKAYGFLPLAQD